MNTQLMNPRPNWRCSECGRVFRLGDAITVETAGTLKKIGGAGMFSDYWCVTNQTDVVRHTACPVRA